MVSEIADATATNATRGGSDRHRAIRDSAAGLFARKGIARTSVREIADSVGILSGSLYHHFSSKDQIVAEIISDYLDDLLTRLRAVSDRGADPQAALEDLIRASLAIIREYPEATQLYQTEGNYIRGLPSSTRFAEIVAEVRRIWIDVLEQGVAEGVFRADINATIAHRLIRDAIWFTVRWFHPTKELTTDDLVAECVGLFVNGVVQRGTV